MNENICNHNWVCVQITQAYPTGYTSPLNVSQLSDDIMKLLVEFVNRSTFGSTTRVYECETCKATKTIETWGLVSTK